MGLREQMTKHYNRSSEKANRRKLRRNSTEALWQRLKNGKLLNLKFRRQYSVDQFVLDFYCPKLKLAIELDGEIHLNKEIKNHDENRDAYLSGFGIKILRIKNDLVINDFDHALEIIKKNIAARKEDIT